MGLDMYLYKSVKFDGYSNDDYRDLENTIPDGIKDLKALKKIDAIVKLNKSVEQSVEFYDNLNKAVRHISTDWGYEYLTIFERIAYWRKANQIHNWFVENAQGGEDDCDYYMVSYDQLAELLRLAKEVRKTKNADLLEPVAGFFFGSTNIDEYYWEDIDLTIEQLSEILDSVNFDEEQVFYRSSW